MKKISKIFAMLVVALVGLSLTACSDGDDLSTDQYGNDISLQSFGPCPVLRGGTLYLYGTNLDQIESVNLPGADHTRLSRAVSRVRFPSRFLLRNASRGRLS